MSASHKRPAALLASMPVLQDLAEREHRALAAYVADRVLEDGAVLFRCGEEAEDLLFLVEGRLRLELGDTEIGVVDAGEIVGALALVSIGRRECDAIADGPLRALALDRQSYLRLRAEDPTTALALQEAILRSLSGVVRDALRG